MLSNLSFAPSSFFGFADAGLELVLKSCVLDCGLRKVGWATSVGISSLRSSSLLPCHFAESEDAYKEKYCCVCPLIY